MAVAVQYQLALVLPVVSHQPPTLQAESSQSRLCTVGLLHFCLPSTTFLPSGLPPPLLPVRWRAARA